MFLRISGWDFGEAEDRSVERMPFHLNEENGYIAVILTQEPGSPADGQHRFESPEVFAVLEQSNSKAWKMERGINGGVGLEVRPFKQRLRPTGSIESLRTNAPDRRVGSLVWYALENLEDERKSKASEHEPGNIRPQKNFRPANALDLSADVIEQLGSSQNLSGRISFPIFATDEPWNPMRPRHRPAGDQWKQ